jgi:SAM-dependent methyltransferase
MDPQLRKTLETVARFYDERKVGDVGPFGFRRSTDLGTILAGLDLMLRERFLIPGETLFLDLGCGDGRVNVFLSYLVEASVGIELDDWTLEEYDPLRLELDDVLRKEGLLPVPRNIRLFHGDAVSAAVHDRVFRETGVTFRRFDLFYTYLVMHEEFAQLIAREGKQGAVFLVYGLQKILPRYPGLHLLDHLSPLEGIVGIYRKA